MFKLLDNTKNISFKIEQRKEKGFLISELKVRGANTKLIGERILHLTDFHLGPSTSEEHLNNGINLSKSLEPSLVLFTGDFIQLTHFGLHHNISRKNARNLSTMLTFGRKVREKSIFLSNLFDKLDPKHGIFSTLGNHDYEEGVFLIKRQIGKSLTWIENENVLVTDFLNIAGVDDIREGKPKIQKAVEGLTKNNFNILLSHNPDIVLDKDAALLDNFDLILCGHTHGGQIRFPKLPIPLTQTKQRVFINGLKSLKEGKNKITNYPLKKSNGAVYVNQGIGFGGIPLRVCCPPEILIISFE